MNGEALDLPDDTFDLSLSIFGAIVFADWRRGFAELVRVTRPGGRVVLASWLKPSPAGPATFVIRSLATAFPDRAPPSAPPGSLATPTAETLATALADTGCREIEAHVQDGAWHGALMDDAEAYCATIRRFAAFENDADPSVRRMVDDLVRTELAARATPSGGVHIPLAANIAIGRKP